MQPSGVVLDVKGSRIYIRGNTYSLRDKIKDAGGHWDPDQKAWWVGIAKRADAEALVAATPAPAAAGRQPERVERVQDDQKIIGKATYQGKAGYLVLWEGTTSRGDAVKLAFRDGSKIFWADRNQVQIDKRYQDREYRGRTEAGMTFGRLKRLAAEYAQARKDGIEPCGKCGGIHRPDEKTCYMCGCTKCEGAQGDLCEDD